MKSLNLGVVRALFPEAGSPGCCSLEEYRVLASRLSERAPCPLLIFGCGRDSVGWARLNGGGRTVFLESEAHWAGITRAQLPGVDVIPVEYPANRSRWRFLVEDCRDRDLDARLALSLPPEICEPRWPCVFVDAPLGLEEGPGRHASLYTARGLTGPGGMLAVHDCDRLMERTLCELLLEDWPLLTECGKLRIYRRPRPAGHERGGVVGREANQLARSFSV